MNHCFNNKVTQSFTQAGRGWGGTKSVEIKNNRFKIDFLEEEAIGVGKFPMQSEWL